MIIIPIILLTILGVSNTEYSNAHSFGLISGIGTLIYCYFEEIGWRGYLHDELGDIKEWKRVLVIGFLWYLWHLSFIDNHNLLSNLVFFAILIIGSWGLGKVIETTKSIFSVTAFHMIINIMFLNGFISNGLDTTNKLIILGISVFLWVLIIIKWDKENKMIQA